MSVYGIAFLIGLPESNATLLGDDATHCVWCAAPLEPVGFLGAPRSRSDHPDACRACGAPPALQQPQLRVAETWAMAPDTDCPACLQGPVLEECPLGDGLDTPEADLPRVDVMSRLCLGCGADGHTGLAADHPMARARLAELRPFFATEPGEL